MCSWCILICFQNASYKLMVVVGENIADAGQRSAWCLHCLLLSWYSLMILCLFDSRNWWNLKTRLLNWRKLRGEKTKFMSVILKWQNGMFFRLAAVTLLWIFGSCPWKLCKIENLPGTLVNLGDWWQSHFGIWSGSTLFAFEFLNL